MSRFFINRPNFSWVIAIFVLLAGILVLPLLSISRFPAVAPPQISIVAKYPGAAAQTLSDSVISVIEEELNGAKGLLYYESSSSSAGVGEITVTFEPGTNPDQAQVDVQNRIKQAEARLPASVMKQGLKIEQANSNFLLFYSLTYKDEPANGGDIVALSDYAVRNINNEIRRVPGVGKLQFFGAEPAMRIWVNPQKLLGYGLSIEDVSNAIAAQNLQVPAGSFGSRPSEPGQELTATIAVKGLLGNPKEFEQIILRGGADGAIVRLNDVARIELGLQDYNLAFRDARKNGVAAAVQLNHGANALETAVAIRERLSELSKSFPENIQVAIPYDSSLFVEEAIRKVLLTLLEAVVLVFLVMYLFLQNFRYTLIPTIVVPVCLAGTLAVMYALGYSLNMMTLFGMVLAIGILVDDAIVVVENVERIMNEEGLPPAEATAKAMRQVAGPIVGITLVLVAVFLPLALMNGSVGVIYRQFSVSLAVSILFSGFLALTFTPALCATLLKPVAKGHSLKQSGFFGAFNRFFEDLTNRFTILNSALIRRSGRYMAIYLVLVALLGVLYVRLPESFVPVEDQGYYLINVQLPPGATFGRTAEVVDRIERYLESRDATSTTAFALGFGFSGMGENSALGYPILKDWSVRNSKMSASEEVRRLNHHFSENMDGSVLAVDPPPMDGLGNASGFSLRLQDRGGLGREKLIAARDALLTAASRSPAIGFAMNEGLPDAPQARLIIDREKAQALGLDFEAIGKSISSAYGSINVNNFVSKGRLQQVVVQSDAKSRMRAGDINSLNVTNSANQAVPFSSFATLEWEEAPVQISRYNGYPAFKITGDAAAGYSTGEAMGEFERMLGDLPAGIGYEWTGLSYQEKVAGGQASLLLALAVLVVFLVLVALYESWSIPLAVMLIVPIGALGAVFAVTLAEMPNDVYFKVGLITTIGLAAKNAILIIEFAKGLREQGYLLFDAALEAARLRLRPVIMTSVAFILGVIPLLFATGAGAASQMAVGAGVVGGMLGATLLGVFFVPIFFVWILSFKDGPRAKKHRQERSDIGEDRV